MPLGEKSIVECDLLRYKNDNWSTKHLLVSFFTAAIIYHSGVIQLSACRLGDVGVIQLSVCKLCWVIFITRGCNPGISHNIVSQDISVKYQCFYTC